MSGRFESNHPFNQTLTNFKLRFGVNDTNRTNRTNFMFGLTFVHLDVDLRDVKPLCIRSAQRLALYTVSNWRSQLIPAKQAKDPLCEGGACMSGASFASILGHEKAVLGQKRYRAGAWVTPAQAMSGMYHLEPADHSYLRYLCLREHNTSQQRQQCL